MMAWHTSELLVHPAFRWSEVWQKNGRSIVTSARLWSATRLAVRRLDDPVALRACCAAYQRPSFAWLRALAYAEADMECQSGHV